MTLLSRTQSLRRRVVGALVLVLAGIQCATAVIVIVNARVATRQEISRGLAAAERLVREAAGRMVNSQGDLAGFLDTLARGSISMRHIEITAVDLQQTGELAQPPRRAVVGRPRPRDDDGAPSWFYELIAPPREERQVVLNSAAQKIGVITIASRAEDEVDEVWSDFSSLMTLATGGSVAAIAILWLVLGRVLRPMTEVTEALGRLEAADYAIRLAPAGTTEIDAVVSRFNSLAEALAVAREENSRLARRLVSIQDDERRHLARELHDEVGPCLFGIKANADSLSSLAPQLPAPMTEKVRQRADQIIAVVDDLQTINRAILKRLRPVALGHVALGDLVDDLVGSTRRIAPEVAITLAVDTARRRFGDNVDLTVYRCVQECLANALRHAAARRIEVRLGVAAGRLALEVTDDGRGREPDAAYGFGLSGMDERVRALGGTLSVARRPEGGTSVRVAIPIDTAFERLAVAEAAQ